MNGAHRGRCINDLGNADAEYDPWDSCELHIRMAERRKRLALLLGPFYLPVYWFQVRRLTRLVGDANDG